MTGNEYLKYKSWLEMPFCTVDYISRILAESDPYIEDYKNFLRFSENSVHIQHAIEDGLLNAHHYEKDIDGFFNDYPILMTLDVIQWAIADDQLTIPEIVKKWASKQCGIANDDKPKQSKPHKSQNKQEQRESVLSEVIEELKAENPNIDAKNLPFYRAEMLEKLFEKDSELFRREYSKNGKIDATFKKFFDNQELCSMKKGAPPKLE
jgi:hypothetical protein